MQERGAAASVKRERPILVVLGNPPYNAYAGVSPDDEDGLVDPYKAGLQSRWGVKKFNLDDLYVRFFRIAERRIAEGTGRGVVSYITNWSWLFLPSFVVMRERLLREFDALWVDNLNGDSRETGKLTPDGLPDPSAFSTEASREGIRVGTAIATLVRHDGEHVRNPRVAYRSFWGTAKRAELLASLDAPEAQQGYQAVMPAVANRYVLRPATAGADYETWPALDSLMRMPPMPGLLEKRGGGLIGIDRDNLERRMRGYLKAASLEQARSANPALAEDRARFDAKRAHALLRVEGYREPLLQRYCFFAFDMRWAYVTAVRPLWNEPRPHLLHVLPEARGFLAVRPQQIAEPEGFPAYWTSCLADDYTLHKHAFLIPVVENLSGAPRPNLSDSARDYLAGLAVEADAAGAALLLHHSLAILYSPAYLAENAGGIRQGWPRIPLPRNEAILRASAALGSRLAALLDTDTPVPGVTSGTPRPELAPIAVPVTLPGQPRNWTLQGWGNRSDKGITMPLRGRTEERGYAEGEVATAARADLLGSRAVDVGMNGSSLWRCVPQAVWECRIGGYQVLKKWLSYREGATIGRPLTQDEVAHVQQTARRLAAVLLLGPELDASYRAAAQAGG